MSKVSFIADIASIRTLVDDINTDFAVTKTEIDAAGDDSSCNNKGAIPGSYRNSPGSNVVSEMDDIVASLENWSGRWS